MIFSTLLSNIIGIYDIDEATRFKINEFKQSNLYNDEYKKCASKHYSTKLFGEPMQCIGESFILSTLETIGGASASIESPDLTHIVRKLNFTDGDLDSIEVISSRGGQVLRVEAEINKNLNLSNLKEIAVKISAIHGQSDITPPNPQMPLWGWKTNDGYHIRLFLDTISRTNKLSITHQNAYHSLRQLTQQSTTIM